MSSSLVPTHMHDAAACVAVAKVCSKEIIHIIDAAAVSLLY